jgi:hypothetical protein
MAFGTDTMIRTRRGREVHWSQLWHLWFLLVPSRGIDGQFLVGRVWRRYDGRQWIYKRLTEYDV